MTGSNLRAALISLRDADVRSASPAFAAAASCSGVMSVWFAHSATDASTSSLRSSLSTSRDELLRLGDQRRVVVGAAAVRRRRRRRLAVPVLGGGAGGGRGRLLGTAAGGEDEQRGARRASHGAHGARRELLALTAPCRAAAGRRRCVRGACCFCSPGTSMPRSCRICLAFVCWSASSSANAFLSASRSLSSRILRSFCESFVVIVLAPGALL